MNDEWCFIGAINQSAQYWEIHAVIYLYCWNYDWLIEPIIKCQLKFHWLSKRSIYILLAACSSQVDLQSVNKTQEVLRAVGTLQCVGLLHLVESYVADYRAEERFYSKIYFYSLHLSLSKPQESTNYRWGAFFFIQKCEIIGYLIGNCYEKQVTISINWQTSILCILTIYLV